MIKTAVVGVGYWGPNLLRNLSDHPEVQVKTICDLDTRLLIRAARRYPAVLTTTHFEDLLRDKDLELVVLATPVHTHATLAIEALNSGKHVLVTKPMATNELECRLMIDAAERAKRILMVDHTFVYHPAVQYMKEMVSKRELGNLLYFQSTRMNLGLYQPDVSVIYDLMAHDLSILNELVKEDPIEISAASKHAAKLPQPDIAYVQLNYQSHFIASIQASWLSPLKIRQCLLTGSKRMVVYDDNDVVQKVKIFDKGVEAHELMDKESSYTKFLQYRQGDVNSPGLSTTEALKNEIEHLVQCLKTGCPPLTNGYEGLRVVRILESADKLARSKKSWIRLSGSRPVIIPAEPEDTSQTINN